MSARDDFLAAFRGFVIAAVPDLVGDAPVTTPKGVYLAPVGDPTPARPYVVLDCPSFDAGEDHAETRCVQRYDEFDDPIPGEADAVTEQGKRATVTVKGVGAGSDALLEPLSLSLGTVALDQFADAPYDVEAVGPILRQPTVRGDGVEDAFTVDVEVVYRRASVPAMLPAAEVVEHDLSYQSVPVDQADPDALPDTVTVPPSE